MSDDHDLVLRLLTLAGTIMEDASAIAILGTDHDGRAERIAAVRLAGADVVTLAEAADVVSRKG